jgi:hypothetical protein
MRKYAIREVETVKTTAAIYGCECCPALCGWPPDTPLAPWCPNQDV